MKTKAVAIVIMIFLVAVWCMILVVCKDMPAEACHKNYTENVTANQTYAYSDNITDFRSGSEIRQWLKDTEITKRRYVRDTYDCDDFAIDTWKMGLAEGRPIGLLVIMRDEDNKMTYFHMANFAMRGNYLYQVEPIHGNVFEGIGGYKATLD